MDRSTKLTASGIAYTGPCEFRGFLLGMDGTNDVTGLAIYDGIDATGQEIIPSNPYEADYKGLNGVVGLRRDCPNGLYVEFTTAGAAEVVVYYRCA